MFPAVIDAGGCVKITSWAGAGWVIVRECEMSLEPRKPPVSEYTAWMV